jgi:hypothetical protein
MLLSPQFGRMIDGPNPTDDKWSPQNLKCASNYRFVVNLGVHHEAACNRAPAWQNTVKDCHASVHLFSVIGEEILVLKSVQNKNF